VTSTSKYNIGKRGAPQPVPLLRDGRQLGQCTSYVPFVDRQT
jgi:hypothetical protein